MNSRDDAFDQYARIADQLGPPPRLTAAERHTAAAARLRRTVELPAVRRYMHGPMLWALQQLAHAMENAAAAHQANPDYCGGMICLSTQVADGLLGNEIPETGHDPDDPGAGRPDGPAGVL